MPRCGVSGLSDLVCGLRIVCRWVTDRMLTGAFAKLRGTTLGLRNQSKVRQQVSCRRKREPERCEVADVLHLVCGGSFLVRWVTAGLHNTLDVTAVCLER